MRHVIDCLDRDSLADPDERHDERLDYGSVVYFVVADAVKMVKIGVTTNLRERLSAIRTSSPVSVRVAGFVLGGRKTERRIQLSFHEHHSHGEWFRLEGRLAEFVQEHALAE